MVLALGMALAGPADAATIQLVSATPSGLAVDVLAVPQPARGGGAVWPAPLRIHRGALIRQMAGFGAIGRCFAAGGVTLATLGVGPGWRAASGLCPGMSRAEAGTGAALQAMLADRVILWGRATREHLRRPARLWRFGADPGVWPRPRPERLSDVFVPVAPVVPILGGGIGTMLSGGPAAGSQMPPAAPVPAPASGLVLVTALAGLLRLRSRSD
ncbi:MAG: hypothetical protein B7Z02_12835 [Rhodobacterales bacterium 32-67-9]|nr:MAG: hypothetical protein B7Z02_12835 [Rhodobacterales bacterium 32-67-9]